MAQDDNSPNYLVGWEGDSTVVLMAYSEITKEWNFTHIPLDVWDGLVQYVQTYRPPNNVSFSDPKDKGLRAPDPADIHLKDFFFP